MKTTKLTQRIAVLGVLGVALLVGSTASVHAKGPIVIMPGRLSLWANIPVPGTFKTFPYLDPITGQWRLGNTYTGLDGKPHGMQPTPDGGKVFYLAKPKSGYAKSQK